jgi:hypothetical protein
MPNIETLLRDHVTLNVDCIDRLYLNSYVPRLQRPENLWWFLTQHRGWPVPSPQLLKRLTDEFVGSIDAFAERHRIPVVRFESQERKEDVARKYLARLKSEEGVVMIGVAQEMVPGFRVFQKGKRKLPRQPRNGPPCSSFTGARSTSTSTTSIS